MGTFRGPLSHTLQLVVWLAQNRETDALAGYGLQAGLAPVFFQRNAGRRRMAIHRYRSSSGVWQQNRVAK